MLLERLANLSIISDDIELREEIANSISIIIFEKKKGNLSVEDYNSVMADNIHEILELYNEDRFLKQSKIVVLSLHFSF